MLSINWFDDISYSQKEFLKDNYNNYCRKAASTIINADCLLLCIGAGFSADSGLCVYKDIANIPIYNELNIDYASLSTPSWIVRKPEIFYGWWGKCFNDYRNTEPHKGHDIIKKWKTKYFTYNKDDNFSYSFAKKQEEQQNNLTTDRFYIYSSNVDSHILKAGFNNNELYEIHGSIEKWQCSRRYCSKSKIKEISTVWNAPEDFIFNINLDTMIAKDIQFDKYNESNDIIQKSFSSNYPKCPHCNSLARPNILMFEDCYYIRDINAAKSYTSWINTTRSFQISEQRKLVILEIGCGNNVPTIRCESHRILKQNPNTTLIRINPEFPLAEGINNNLLDNTIPIMGKGLETLEIIDKYIHEIENTQ